MHEDGTEHQWTIVTVTEQGQELPVFTYCPACKLSAWDLWKDQMAERARQAPPKPVEDPSDRAVRDMNMMFSGVALDLDQMIEG